MNMFLVFILCCLIDGLLGSSASLSMAKTGYVKVNVESGAASGGSAAAEMFYYYFEPLARANSSAPEPLIIWIQGGPGCSAVMGVFSECGPFRLGGSAGDHLELNPFTWNQYGAMLLFDSPVGTGFSYGPVLAQTDDEVAGTLARAIVQLAVQKPGWFRGRPVVVSGESYAGKIVPRVALSLAAAKFPVAGVSVGNGLFDSELQVPSYADHLYNVGMLGPDQRQAGLRTQAAIVADIQAGRWANATAMYNAYQVQLFEDAGMPDPSDLRYYGFNRLNFTGEVAYVNAHSKQLGARVSFSQVCNNAVGQALANEVLKSARPFYEQLLDQAHQIPVLIYNGNFDYTIPTPSVWAFVDALQWSGAAQFRSASTTVWTMAGSTAGYRKSHSLLSVTVVGQAGHMVPMSQPKRAQNMFETWLTSIIKS